METADKKPECVGECRAFVTCKSWLDGKLLEDFTMELEGVGLKSHRQVDPLYDSTGQVMGFAMHQITYELTGKLVEPEHPAYPWFNHSSANNNSHVYDGKVYRVPRTAGGMKFQAEPKSVEQLEKEMYDWVAGNKDYHDGAIDAYKAQVLDQIKKEMADLETLKQTVQGLELSPEVVKKFVQLIDRYSGNLKFLTKYSAATPGRLGIRNGKVVDLGAENNKDGEYLVEKWNEAVEKGQTSL